MAGLASKAARCRTVVSRSPAETRRLGEVMGKLAPAGTRILLYGDLGAGKTVFVQGLASGLEVPSDYYITSPTYTIVNEYPGRLCLYHLDLYRFETADDLEGIGFDDMVEGPGLVVIEWAERLPDNYLETYLAVEITGGGDDDRTLRLIPYGQAATDLIGEMKKN